MKTAVLMIDLQNAYFEDPALASRRESVVEAANLLVRTATAAQVPVLLVRTEHQRDQSTWTLNMLDDDQGFIFEGSEQASFLPGLLTDGLESIVKTRDSAFFGTGLAERLRREGVERLVLAGVATHDCVAQTAADAFAHNFRVVFAKDVIASTNEDYAGSMLQILGEEYRQPVLGRGAIAELLAGARER
ncbi:cysteine hydrolase [Arthrobacter sp. CAU 1506]|uniref:cysteine hydrolase family protein n=1 Tax=Arthrobacter sp. CAU 1506 TaxID=2560052 RepID=UPI0010AC3C90|nr:isochorismatase family cysteine hydrolase [Arthrobacter sp. CAU 1506]TJY70065.1 cysteine hydrolase [Arthrobacter sp. CAU 1506]